MRRHGSGTDRTAGSEMRFQDPVAEKGESPRLVRRPRVSFADLHPGRLRSPSAGTSDRLPAMGWT